MITPKWLNTLPTNCYYRCFTILKSTFNPATYNQSFDIGGPDILTYKEMLLALQRLKI
jgi:hypothetical protein